MAVNKTYLVSVGFYVLALAAEVSGITSQPLALFLALIATVIICYALFKDRNRILTLSGPLLLGVIGALLIVAAIIWNFAGAPKPAPSQAEGRGGAGGVASVSGDGIGIGGKGGAGGVSGAGGTGGSATVSGGGLAVGGEGGEAGQADRGGRGGRSGYGLLGLPDKQLPDGTWLSDAGRGGDGAGPPKRTLDPETQSIFVQLLRGRLPDGGTAEIGMVDIQFRPLAETLDALFKMAGWQTVLNKAPINPHQIKEVQGVGVAAYNKFYMEALESVFQSVGFKDTYTELRHSDVPRDNPKWPMVQSKTYVTIGFPKE